MKLRLISSALLVTACASEPGSGDDEDNADVACGRPGVCASLCPVSVSAPELCQPSDPLLRDVSNELVTLWGTQPSGTCQYRSETQVGQCDFTSSNAFYCRDGDAIGWDIGFL